MRFSFIIKGRLAGANEIKSADRSHWSIGAKLKKDTVDVCRWHIMFARKGLDGPLLHPAVVSFAWIEPNGKRDLDNISSGQKAILDALVLCGVLRNDTRRWVRKLVHDFPDPDPVNPRIEVVVEEILSPVCVDRIDPAGGQFEIPR